MINRRKLAVAVVAAGLWPALALSGPATGSLKVGVVDSQGRPLDGASVRITGTGPDRALETDRTGLARFAGVTPGTYAVVVRHRGLEPDAGPPVVNLRAGRMVQIKVRMRLAYYPPDGDMPRIPQPQN